MKNISEEIYNSNHIAVEDVRIPILQVGKTQKIFDGVVLNGITTQHC